MRAGRIELPTGPTPTVARDRRTAVIRTLPLGHTRDGIVFEQPGMEQPTTPTVRDSRIDRLGSANELQRQIAAEIKEPLKATLLRKEVDKAAADLFEAQIIHSAGSRAIDAEELLKLWEKKKITRAEFLSALRVNVAAAKEFLSEKQIDKISVLEPVEPSMKIKIIPGRVLSIDDCLHQLVYQRPGEPGPKLAA